MRHLLRSAAAALAALAVLATSAPAQPASKNPLDPPPNGPRRSDPSHHVLVGGRIHVAPGNVIPEGVVEIRSGRIVSVAPTAWADFHPPEGARVWDVRGYHIYPGFIDAYVEVDTPRIDPETPGAHWNRMVTPQRSVLDGNGIPDSAAEELRKLGFAAAAISPMNPTGGDAPAAGRGRRGGGDAKSGGIFRGTSALVSLAKAEADRSDGMPPIYRNRTYHSVAFELASGDREGDQGWRGYPDSQMGAIAIIRQTFADADWQAVRRMSGEFTGPSNALDALAVPQTAAAIDPARSFSSQSQPFPSPFFLFNTDDELEAHRAFKIAQEFNRPLVILGSGMEFRRLDAVKADGAPVILPLNFPKAPDVSSRAKAEATDLREMMTWEQAPTNPRRLDAAGVNVVLTSSKLRSRAEFSENLKKAIKHGLAPEKALAMLTTKPAELLNASKDLGTVESGKVANLIVATGDLFEPTPPAKAGADGTAKTNPAPDPKPDAKPDSKPDAKSDAKSDAKPKPAKILDLWIDGKRHEINPTPEAALAGTWELTMTPALDAPARVIFSDDTPPKVSVYSLNNERKPRTLETRNVQVQGKTVSFIFDHDEFGAPGVCSVSLLYAGSRHASDSDTIAGTAVLPNGRAIPFTGVRRKPSAFDGHWRVFEYDGKVTDENDKDSVTLEFKDDQLAVVFRKDDGSPTRIEAENVKIDGNAASFTHPLKPLGGEGNSTDSVRLEGGVLIGVGTLPGGEKHEYKAKLTPKQRRARPAPPPGDGPDAGKGDAGKPDGGKPESDEEDDASDKDIASIPEKLGYPFGPYQRDGIPAQPEVLILTGATVWTSNAKNEVIENAAVIVRKGKIDAVVKADTIKPESFPGATIVTLPAGSHITPGLIDCHSHTGISKGVNESGQAVTSEVRIQDVTNPDAINWYRQLAGGLTTVNNLHGSANAIGGQNCVNKIRWGVLNADDMHFEGALPGIKFALGENVKQSNWGDRFNTRYPQTRMGVETLIRDRFTAAREYLAAKASGKEKDGTPFRRDLELEALGEILEGKRLVHCHSYRQDEILMLARVAREFGFKIGTYQHILEGYKVADAIRESALGASCFSDWWAYKVEVQDAIPQAGPIMWEEGVTVSFNSDSDELARRMNAEAAKAVKYASPDRPISKAEALKFVTLNPAIQLAIQDRVGSIEPGKDADLAVWSAEPLSIYARCLATYIDGRQYWSVEQDAKDRQWNQEQRTRLIQKLLSEKKRSGPGGPGGRGRGGREMIDSPEPKPTDQYVSDAQRAYYLRLMQQGMDPMAARAGDCGLCNAINNH
jgi:N-acetylglucosamine-6-phosphate deacetylase